jgi:hypothetical protein
MGEAVKLIVISLVPAGQAPFPVVDNVKVMLAAAVSAGDGV